MVDGNENDFIWPNGTDCLISSNLILGFFGHFSLALFNYESYLMSHNELFMKYANPIIVYIF